MSDHPSATARVFRQPTDQERAAGASMFVQPPISVPQETSVAPVAAPWWTAIQWWVYLVIAIILALIVVLIVAVS